MKGCEEAFGSGRRGESTVSLRSDGGCEIIPDRPAKVFRLLFFPSFPISSSFKMKRVTQRLCRKLLALLVPFSPFFSLLSPPSPFHSQTRLKEKMSGMQQRIKWREGPLQPTHTCWASTPNLSKSISSPPPVQSNHITLVSNQRALLHHSSPPHIPLLYSAFFFSSWSSSPALCLWKVQIFFLKGNRFGRNVLGPSSAVGRHRSISICLNVALQSALCTSSPAVSSYSAS